MARDAAGEPVALLALDYRRFGPFAFAALMGGRMANYQMALLSDPAAWTPEAARALILAVARRARLDLVVMPNLAAQWRGGANPLAALGASLSPSFAYCTRLEGGFDAWAQAHFSASARKKRRAKTRKLAEIAPPRHERAGDAAGRRAALDAFLAQKRARMRARALPNLFDAPAPVAWLERLSEPSHETPDFEWHVVKAGERIVSVFGGLVADGRLCGLVFSHDIAADVAPASPGELLVMEIVRDAFQRGLAEFDLGIGEARYKSECCEIVEPLVDAALARTILGGLAGRAYLAARALKRWIKHSPELFDSARVVQRWLFTPRAR